jgi:hypothetical protein
MKATESWKALRQGIEVKSPGVRALLSPVKSSEIEREWVSHKQKTDNSLAAEGAEGGADWVNVAEGCGFQGSMNPVVFMEVPGSTAGSPPTAFLVYEQVPVRKNATPDGCSPCDVVHIRAKEPSGNWACRGR